MQGRVAITGFYQRAIDKLHPQPRVEDILEKADRYVEIVDVPNDKGRTRAADLFELGEDGIRQLASSAWSPDSDFKARFADDWLHQHAVQEWYVFAELRFELRRRSDGQAAAIHIADYFIPASDSRFIMRVGQCPDPA